MTELFQASMAPWSVAEQDYMELCFRVTFWVDADREVLCPCLKFHIQQ